VRFSDNFAAEIRALAAHGRDAAREALVRALLDERPREARVARYALARARLMRLYRIAWQRHTRTQVLALLGIECLPATHVSERPVTRFVTGRFAFWRTGR